jgi:hypothetical protein
MHLSVNIGPTNYFMFVSHSLNIHMQVRVASVFLNKVILYDERAE